MECIEFDFFQILIEYKNKQINISDRIFEWEAIQRKTSTKTKSIFFKLQEYYNFHLNLS